jgi:hypothetical protein
LRSEVLKDSSLQALTDEHVYKNHFNIHIKETNDRNNKNTNQRSIIIHKVRGIDTIQSLKAEPKIMEYLRSNNIHISIHNWKEEEWDLKVLGFFTHLHPGKMTIEYFTKIVSNMIKSPKKYQSIPKFRIKPIIMRTSTNPTNLSVRTYAIEVKAQESREMMSIF